MHPDQQPRRAVIEHTASLERLAAGLNIDHATGIFWIYNDPAARTPS